MFLLLYCLLKLFSQEWENKFKTKFVFLEMPPGNWKRMHTRIFFSVTSTVISEDACVKMEETTVNLRGIYICSS